MFLSPISAFPRSKGGCLSDKIVSPKSEHLTPQQLLRLYSNISEVDTDVSSSLAVDDLITSAFEILAAFIHKLTFSCIFVFTLFCFCIQ